MRQGTSDPGTTHESEATAAPYWAVGCCVSGGVAQVLEEQ